MNTVTRPDFLTDDMLTYLDDLRESGATNMFGAGPYVEDAFDLDSKRAREVVVYWMKTFGERHRSAP